MIKAEEMVATTKATQEIMGHLFWYSVSNQQIKAEELKQHLIDSGLGEGWMPNRIRPVDAFRRATREIQTRKITPGDAKVVKNYLVREVFSDLEQIQRNIVIEIVDPHNKDLVYQTKSGIIRLDKKYGSLFFETEDPEIEKLCVEAEEKFDLYRNHYSSQHIRVLVTKILNSLAPTPMRENGIIYFVPNSMTTGLINLVTFIRALGSEAYKVPVVNTNDNRYMVTKKLNDYLDHLIEQCRHTEGLRKDQIKTLVEETNAAIKDYKEYKEFTTSVSEKFEAKLSLLRSEVIKLLNDN